MSMTAASLPHNDAVETTAAILEKILENHLRLDQAIDIKLNEIVSDTETSALSIMTQVRALHDTAGKLSTYNEGVNLGSADQSKEIADSVARLGKIASFVEGLPAKMRRDLQDVQVVVKEIKELGELVSEVKAVSLQSHMLSINTAIEAARAGPTGGPFRVIATEVRSLASNSKAVATKINAGLSRARDAIEVGMASNIAKSSEEIDTIAGTAASIRTLQERFDDMIQYNKTRFAVVAKHNEDLAAQIAEVLGHMQYQDVVRQCVERIQAAILQRNAFFQHALDTAARGSTEVVELPELLKQILNDFLAKEEVHKHSGRVSTATENEPKIELF